jgi:hypothetical protein
VNNNVNICGLPIEIWFKISEAADFPVNLRKTCKFIAQTEAPYFDLLLSRLKEINAINEKYHQKGAKEEIKALYQEIKEDVKEYKILIKEDNYTNPLSIERLNQLQKEIRNMIQSEASSLGFCP